MRIVSSSSNLTDLKPLDAPADNLPLELELVIILASLRLDHRLERRPDGDAARHLSTWHTPSQCCRQVGFGAPRGKIAPGGTVTWLHKRFSSSQSDERGLPMECR